METSSSKSESAIHVDPYFACSVISDSEFGSKIDELYARKSLVSLSGFHSSVMSSDPFWPIIWGVKCYRLTDMFKSRISNEVSEP